MEGRARDKGYSEVCDVDQVDVGASEMFNGSVDAHWTFSFETKIIRLCSYSLSAIGEGRPHSGKQEREQHVI